MIAALRRACFFAMIVTAPASVLAQAKPSIVVVPVKGKGGGNLAPQMKLLEKQLNGQATIVPFKDFQKAAKKAKVKPKDLGSSATARQLGEPLKASHVLVVESKSEKVNDGKKKKVQSLLAVTLVDVASGDVVFSNTFTLKGKKLTPDVAGPIASAVKAKLLPSSPSMPAPVDDTPPPAPPETPAPPPEPPPAADTLAAAPAAPLPAESSPAPATEPVPEPSAASTPPPVLAALSDPPPPDATLTVSDETPHTKRNKSWRPGLSFRLGPQGFMRTGEVRDAASGKCGPDDSAAVCYGGDPFVAGAVELELYPLAIGGTGRWYEGIGIEARAVGTQAVTVLDDVTKETSKNTVAFGQGGLSLRFVLWESASAVDIRLRGGYGYMQFPLPARSFPGVKLTGPYGGAAITLPIIPEFAFVIAGTYTPMLTLDGRVKQLGKIKKAVAFDGDAGVKLNFDPFQIQLLGSIRQYQGEFTGQSTLEGLTQFADAKYTDRYLAGTLFFGFGL